MARATGMRDVMPKTERHSIARPSCAENVPHVATTPEMAQMARCLGRICDDAGARAFSLMLVSPGMESRRLIPCLDTDYPVVSALTGRLLMLFAERLVRRAVSGTQPCWWAIDENCETARSMLRCLWAERIPHAPGLEAGVAMPLFDETGSMGVIVLSGGDVSLNMAALAEIQVRCLGIFSSLAPLRSGVVTGTKAISRRELECLKLTANGLTSEEIAVELGLSVHTANQYLTNTTQKLNSVNRMHAVAKALRLGLID